MSISQWLSRIRLASEGQTISARDQNARRSDHIRLFHPSFAFACAPIFAHPPRVYAKHPLSDFFAQSGRSTRFKHPLSDFFAQSGRCTCLKHPLSDFFTQSGRCTRFKHPLSDFFTMFRAGVSVPINEPRAAIWLSIFHGVIGVSDNTIRAIGGSEFSD